MVRRLIVTRPWQVLYLFVLVVVTVVIAWTGWQAIRTGHKVEDQQRRLAKFSSCLADWADATSARGDLLTSRALDRTEATDRLVRALSHSGADRLEFQRAVRKYLKASDKYKKIVIQHPVPVRPEFGCNQWSP